MTSPLLPSRRPWCAALALAVVACLAPAAAGQPPPLRVEVEKVRVGFLSYDREGGDFFYAKPDLWAPVQITLTPAADGSILLPVGVDDFVRGEALIETLDNDGTPNVYPQKFALRKNDDLLVLSYVKTSGLSPSVKVSFRADGQTFGRGKPETVSTLELNHHLYLTAGARLEDFQAALLQAEREAARQPGGAPPVRCLRERRPEVAAVVVRLSGRGPDAAHDREQELPRRVELELQRRPGAAHRPGRVGTPRRPAGRQRVATTR